MPSEAGGAVMSKDSFAIILGKKTLLSLDILSDLIIINNNNNNVHKL